MLTYLGVPRSSAQFSHPETVVLRKEGDYFITDEGSAAAGTCTQDATLSSEVDVSFQIQAYHMDEV